MRPTSHIVVFACLAFLWTTWSEAALAGTLQVNPVLVEIDSDRRTASITVTNEEDAPVTIRAHALAWRQEGGDNVYGETSDLIVSPPVFTLPPRATQTVRVGLRRPTFTGNAYRLIVEEVPAASPGGGIQVALRLDLPLFVNMTPAHSLGLRWSVQRQADGAWALETSNPGSNYVRLDHEAASSASGLRFGDNIFFGTILPGGTRRWLIGRDLTIVDRDRLQSIIHADERAPTRTAFDRR